MTPEDFQKTILEAVDEGLSSLGESPKQAILFHLENTFKVRRDEIPKNLAEFKRALEKIFGPGTLYLERLILEKLREKLDLKFEIENPDLLNNVEELKKRLFNSGDA
ncbi:MAG: hypothetical protein NZ932_05030 [Candidatus Bathyarchaeota archaeon]|nr:hypothetical protein [Candidatus Bathyarchaeota archaeon]MDW8040714.1 hypothetical protein [Nitrososphaerota archaeon]